jgi:hypothetical protein
MKIRERSNNSIFNYRDRALDALSGSTGWIISTIIFNGDVTAAINLPLPPPFME